MDSTTVTTLSQVIQPLFYSDDPNLRRASHSNEQADRMMQGASILEATYVAKTEGHDTSSWQELYDATKLALTLSLDVLARANDSYGEMADVCETLIDLLPIMAAHAKPDKEELARWFIWFHSTPEIDYFELDPHAFAHALGDVGLSLIRTWLTQLTHYAATHPDEHHSPSEDTIEYFHQRLAVIDGDPEAVLAAYLEDAPSPAQRMIAADALFDINEVDLALNQLKQAALAEETVSHKPTFLSISDTWRYATDRNKPSERTEVARIIFDHWPTANNARMLCRTVNKDGQDDIINYVRTNFTDKKELKEFDETYKFLGPGC